MNIRWRLAGWVGLLVGLGLWLWPLDPSVSIFDLPGVFGGGSVPFPPAPGNALDALFADQPIGGTALIRLWIGAVLIVGTVAIEVILARRSKSEGRDQLPPAPSEAHSGYSSGG